MAGLAGLFTGVLGMFAFRRSEQERTRLAAVPQPELPPGLTDVLAVLRSAAILLDAGQEVSTASPAAYAFGLVRGHDLVHSELHDMATEARRFGVVRERELELPRGPLGLGRLVVNARVAPLGSEYVLVLVDDRTEARRVEEVRRDFVANVSHELKTPIGALKLLAEAVSDASDDPEAVQHFAARMEREAQRLATLVQEIIDLSRLQVADALHPPEPVGVDVVISDAVDRVRLAAQRRQITVTTGGDLGAIVYGDRDLLVTAVRNLVDNAIAYSPEGRRVAVFVRRVDGLVEIAVKDQGFGIPKADLERIFERFYRVDPARSRATGGTGLGLSIVKHVTANHGGEVTVWSEEGVGSTFTLRLPDSSHAAATADGAPSSPAVLTDPPVSPVLGLPLHADWNGMPSRGATS
ncbi:MAG: two-component sensor histidine kinase [Kineosporiaceae bacterium]|nr:two-component sensor histidine kinase [Kineosporiaceae bacterium]MBK7623174.1 two-component sensor histidine kinase [Kineosporiaceae bacterium]MBK8074874.1 two-component sensor histidine kinase [Kineosporiaceae bacterium]